MADPKNETKSKTSDNETRRDTSSTGTVNKEAMRDPKNSLSSTGAKLSDEAETHKEDGMTVLDAGGPYVAAAPAPTPAEAVSYPATGGLPDTGPHSKYSADRNRGPELYDKEGNRVDRDGVRLNEFGDRFYPEVQDPPRPEDSKHIPASIQAEMEAGKKALGKQ